MFARISYTWELMGSSWAILKKDKALVLFPLFSGISCLVVIASFIIPLFVMDIPALHGKATPTQADKFAGYAYLFGFYFVNYFVITFFNVGIVACAASRMAGGEPTFAGGFREAVKRIHLIVQWALVSATVGLILKIIENYNKKIGRFVAGLLGAAWTTITFLVVPVLVVEDKGPIDALKESATLLKKTWGTQLVGNFSFGLIFSLLMLPGLAAGAAGFFLMASTSAFLGLMLIGVAVTYVIGLALIQSALQSIFQAAVYLHTQGVPDATRAFPVKLLRDAMNEA
jgi:hypothetical protein